MVHLKQCISIFITMHGQIYCAGQKEILHTISVYHYDHFVQKSFFENLSILSFEKTRFLPKNDILTIVTCSLIFLLPVKLRRTIFNEKRHCTGHFAKGTNFFPYHFFHFFSGIFKNVKGRVNKLDSTNAHSCKRT